MRKITKIIKLDDNTFQPIITFIVSDPNSNNRVKIGEYYVPAPCEQSRYSLEEQLIIDHVNSLLLEQNGEIMTQEESDYLIDPTGVKWGKKVEEVSEEELQRLSGFTVEKKITFYNDLEKINIGE